MEHNDSIIVSYISENPTARYKRNLMYCFDCKRMYVGPDSVRHATNLFGQHCKSAEILMNKCTPYGEAKPSKLKGMPRQRGTMTTPAAPKRAAGIWFDEATLVQLRAKYPSIAACYEYDEKRLAADGTQEYDFMKTLESMCKLLTIGEEQERKMRGTAKKSTSAFTGDPWEAVGRELLHDEAIADGYDQLTNGALEYYKTEVIDWKIAKNKDATKKDLPTPYPDVEMDSDDDMSVDEIELIEPDDNVHRTVIREAVLDSIKRLNRKPKKLSPVADAAPTAPVSVPPGDEAPLSGCKSE